MEAVSPIGNGGVTHAPSHPFPVFSLSTPGRDQWGPSCSWHGLTAGGPNNCCVDRSSRLAGVLHTWRGDITDVLGRHGYVFANDLMLASAKPSMSVGANHAEVRGSKPFNDIPLNVRMLFGSPSSGNFWLLSGHPVIIFSTL